MACARLTSVPCAKSDAPLTRGSSVGTGGQRYAYDAYGNAANGVPATGQPFRYTGRRLDAETGLYYYRARYYAPQIGRFLQTDPIGTKDDLNLYAYVYNDSPNATDPMGLKGCSNGSPGVSGHCPSDSKRLQNARAKSASRRVAQLAEHVGTSSGVAETAARGVAAVAEQGPGGLEETAGGAGKVAGVIGNAATGVQIAAQLAEGDAIGATKTGAAAAVDVAVGALAAAGVIALGHPELAHVANAAGEASSNLSGFSEKVAGPAIEVTSDAVERAASAAALDVARNLCKMQPEVCGDGL
ncbi:MAG: RHS repeat-associated core domain-containing protein [Steroidobacteraceae bacterium]